MGLCKLLKGGRKLKKNWKIFIGVVVIGVLVFGILFLNSTRKPPIGPGAQTPYSEISLTDSEVYEILRKFNFEISTQASIYKARNFKIGYYEERPIPNDLILRMAWDKISMTEDVVRKIDEEESMEIATEEAMEKSVRNLFGNKISYENESFNNIDCQTFAGYNVNPGTIFYGNGQYIAHYLEGGGGSVPYLYQVVQKAIKEGIEIKLVVKTAFIDAFFNEDINDFTYNLYSDFDFDTEKFENQVISVSEKEFYQDIPETVEAFQSIRLVDNHVFEQIKEKLNTYEYTFQKDSETEGYYLVGFQKI